MASGAVSRKTTSSSSNSRSYSSTSAGNLDNNLDALLDDLQTSISSNRNGGTSHHNSTRIIETTPQHSSTRIIETTPYSTTRITESPHSSTRIIEKSTTSRNSPLRSMSPSQGRTTTLEKYVSTGPAGTPSGIPGLEMLDAELADVQPGQSKTVAYKQVSYHYDKQQEGKNLEPWMKTDTTISKNDASIVDEFCQRTFENSPSARPSRDSPDFAKSNKEIIYKADVSTKSIPTVVPTETRSTERDFKYVKETSYRTEPSPVSPRKNIKTVRTDETEELTNVEYIPASSPIERPSIPANLAPGPNTKVTTTIKTYTYELPGAPETYTVPPPTTTTTSTISKNINVDKSISYSLPPRDTEKTVTYHVEDQRSAVREYVPQPSPSPSRVRREEKVYMEERRGYRTASPPPQPQPVTEGSRTTIKQYEEHYSGSSRPPRPTYYPGSDSSHHSSTTVYKYDEQQSLLPRPFPTSERPASPRQQPPRRIEDLMASFSDSEEVVEVMEKRDRKTTKETTTKKEVDFVPHTPPVVKSKNVAGPPVYYPPGSGEFTKKEEMMGAMSKASGGWAAERAAWEYGASSRSEEKVKTKKAVVPVCLPLCCALPCVIM